MPTYDFECVKCHHKFEQKLSFDDEGVTECPRCRGEARRLFSAVPVIFKGSGFYITDHRKGGTADSTAKPEEKTVTKVSAAKPEETTK
jgi:putative FmdB family regulatory protein